MNLGILPQNHPQNSKNGWRTVENLIYGRGEVDNRGHHG